MGHDRDLRHDGIRPGRGGAPDRAEVVHISSAVVRCRPETADEVAAAINRLPDAEVFHSEGGRIVVVLEGPTTKAMGSRLSEIGLMSGVLSATMVYEQAETLKSLGECP